MCARAALTNIEIIESEGLVENSAEMGIYFLDKLKALQETHTIIGDVRGLGLLLGVEIVKNRETKESFPDSSGIAEILNKSFRAQGLILFASNKGISMGPPLCIQRNEVDYICGEYKLGS